jgi:hypothetical protein
MGGSPPIVRSHDYPDQDVRAFLKSLCTRLNRSLARLARVCGTADHRAVNLSAESCQQFKSKIKHFSAQPHDCCFSTRVSGCADPALFGGGTAGGVNFSGRRTFRVVCVF